MGSLNNEELILRPVQPMQGIRGTQDELKNCEDLGPGKNVLNFNLPAFTILSRSANSTSCLYDLLSQLSRDGALPGPKIKAFSDLGTEQM